MRPARQKAAVQLGLGDVDPDRQIKQRRKIRPRGFVQQKVIAFDNQDAVLRTNDVSPGAANFQIAVKERDRHLVFSAKPRQKVTKARHIKGVRRAFAGAGAAGDQHRVIIVKAVHRDGLGALPQGRNQFGGQRRFACTRWAGKGGQKPPLRVRFRADRCCQLGRGHACSVTPSGSFAPVMKATASDIE